MKRPACRFNMIGQWLETVSHGKRMSKKKLKTYRAEIIQGGIVVAEVYAPTAAQCEREIMHYAMMYAQDGEVTIHLPKGMVLMEIKP